MTWLQLIQTHPGFTITMLVFGFAFALMIVFTYNVVHTVKFHMRQMEQYKGKP